EVDNLKDEHFIQLFDILAGGEVAKEGIEKILRLLAKEPSLSAKEAVANLGLTGIDTAQIEKFIESVVASRQDFVREKGMAAVGPLMGVVMAEFRGKVDGKILSETLKQKVSEFLGK
ncbi:MAG: GatB/YqeY domain-containing protein, partial [Methanosarcinaceae archaeon]|nr:GatB/YqeY domain-containing protein [Methanosarcinaceae archaeon]